MLRPRAWPAAELAPRDFTMTVIVNSGSTFTPGLTLTADGTIEAGGTFLGAGTISGAFELLNEGQITGNSGTLTIDTGSFDNQGTLEATVGGNVTIGASVNVLDLSNGTLTAGTWYPFGGVISVPGPPITVDDASIDLSSAGMVTAGSVSVLNSLTQIGTAGALTLEAMGDVFLAGPFVDSGVLSVDFTNLSVADLTVTSGGQLILHFGSFEGPLTLNGVLEMAPAGELVDLPGAITGTGTIEIDTGVLISGPRTLTQAMVNNGNVVIQTSGPGVTIANSLSGTGEIDVDAGRLTLETGTSNTISFNRGFVQAAAVLDDPTAFAGTILGSGQRHRRGGAERCHRRYRHTERQHPLGDEW
jgi:hypothetical protein